MPQFDPAVWPPQLVWLAICFVILYILMAKVALPRVADILEEREFRINDSLRKAEGLKQDAEDAVAAYEKLMVDARAKAQEEVRRVRERAAKEAAERHAELTERLAGQIETAEVRIAKARDAAVADLAGLAVEVAGFAVERLIGERIDPGVITTAVNSTMKEVA